MGREVHGTSLVYKCTARDEKREAMSNYIGLTGGKIKPRISVHHSELNDIKKANQHCLKRVVNEMDKGIKAGELILPSEGHHEFEVNLHTPHRPPLWTSATGVLYSLFLWWTLEKWN